MKKLLIGMIALSACIFTSANAQETTTHQKGEHVRHEMHHSFKQLNLTAAQKEQMKQDRDAFKKQMADLDKQDQITVKEYKERKAALAKEQKAKFQNVLTAEQKAQLAKLKEDKKAEFKANSTKRLVALKTKLNLTDQQMVAIKANHDKEEAAIKAVHDNTSLTTEQKKESLATIHKESKDAFKQVLTDEQKKQLEDMKGKFGK